MKTLIIGAGAIGCLVGGKLARSGMDVTLAGRQHTVAAVEAHGLRLADETGAHAITNLAVVDSVAAAYRQLETPFDLVILTVKAYDTEAAVDELTAALRRADAPTPAVMSLQNGVGNEQLIAEKFTGFSGESDVIGGSITTPVTVLGTADIRVDRPKYTLGIGQWLPSPDTGADSGSNPRIDPEPLDRLQHMLSDAGFSVTVYEDVRSLKWTKLLMNMVGNASSAILDEPPDQAFQDAGIVDIEIDAWREAFAVMAALEIEPINLGSYPFANFAPWIRRTPKSVLRPILRRQVGGARGGKMPSLHIDLHRDKGKNEVGWLNGAVVKYGRIAKVPTPVNLALTKELTGLVHDPSKRSLWRHNRLRLVVCVEEYKARVS